MKNSVYIIAEAGVNHNGDIKIAKELIDVAKESGANAIKFQTFSADRIVSKNTPKAEYQTKNQPINETQYEMLKRLEISDDDHYTLIEHCKKKKIEFLSSAFDLESIDFLNKLNLATFKIPSGEITNIPYLRKIGLLNKNVLLSTGLSDLKEIEIALDTLIKAGTSKENISILHACSEYPAPFEDINLSAIKTIEEAFSTKVGYSDHTTGYEAAVAAVAIGATIIEKHFTLDKNMEGPDHKASANSSELFNLVKAVRNIEKALGDGIKEPKGSEIKNIAIVRKSIVASKNIKKGETFSESNLTVKRPGNGLSPALWDSVTGKTANKDFNKDDIITI